MLPIAAGRRDRRIQIQQAAKAPDAAGQQIPTWSLLAECWAAIEPLSGRELWAAKQSQATVTHRITCPYVAGVTPRMQIVSGGRTFTIDSVLDREEAHVELEILATEIV